MNRLIGALTGRTRRLAHGARYARQARIEREARLADLADDAAGRIERAAAKVERAAEVLAALPGLPTPSGFHHRAPCDLTGCAAAFPNEHEHDPAVRAQTYAEAAERRRAEIQAEVAALGDVFVTIDADGRPVPL